MSRACRRDRAESVGDRVRHPPSPPGLFPPASPASHTPEVIPSQSSSLCMLPSASQSCFRCISCSTPPAQLLSCPSAYPSPLLPCGNPTKGIVVPSPVPFPQWPNWAFLLLSHHSVPSGGGKGGLRAGCPLYPVALALDQPRCSHTAHLGSSGVSSPAVCTTQ